MSIFFEQDIARKYDEYYQSDFGRIVDKIEKEIISQFVKKIPRGKLLELGCGTGHWTEFFVQEGFRVIGVDNSKAMLNIAKQKKNKAKFLLANSENLPFNNESHSIIASITMIEFVKNQQKAIQEMYRVLKKNGWLIIGCLNAESTIGLNKQQDDVFKYAKLFKLSDLKLIFNQFKLLQLKPGVYLNEKYDIINSSNCLQNIEPAFVGLLLQK